MDFVSCAIEDLTAVVTLNRPPVNAVNVQMYTEIRDAFNGLHESLPEARVAILRAEGRHFCAGNDLDDFESLTPGNSPGRMQLVRETFWSIHDSPLPVIAAVQGSALGTGLALAASADLIVCAEDAQFGLPELSVGVLGGARHLGRLLPQQLVRQAFLTSDPISGELMGRYGGAAEVVPSDQLQAAAHALADRIARHSARAILMGKRSLNQIEWMDLKAGYELEQGYTGDLSGYPEAKAALRAIRERRSEKPRS